MSAAKAATGSGPHNHIILAANITRALNISVAELQTNAASIVASFGGPADSSKWFLAREYYSGETREVSVGAPLVLGPQKLKPQVNATACKQRLLLGCFYAGALLQECAGRGFTHEYCTPFELWTLTPITPGLNFLLVGEKDKYVALSPQRFSDYSANQAVVGHPGHLKATVKGSPGEKVTVEAAKDGGMVEVACEIGASGTSKLDCQWDSLPNDSKCTCA